VDADKYNTFAKLKQLVLEVDFGPKSIVGSLWNFNIAIGLCQTYRSNVQSMWYIMWYIEQDGNHPPTFNFSKMVSLLNISSCALANFKVGDYEKFAQVDALLLMSDLQCVGQLGALVHCCLYETVHKLGLFHHPLLKFFHELLYSVLYLYVHIWFMENSICDFNQTRFKSTIRRIWALGSSCATFVIWGFF